MKRLKQLEEESRWLKKLVADLSLDKQILKEVAEGNSWARRGSGRRSGKCRRS